METYNDAKRAGDSTPYTLIYNEHLLLRFTIHKVVATFAASQLSVDRPQPIRRCKCKTTKG